MGDRPSGRPLRGRRVRQPQRTDRSPQGRRGHLTLRRAALALLLGAATPVAGQDLSAWFEGSASHTQPPAGVTAESQFGLVGGRLDAEFDWGSATFSGRYGQALAGNEQWLQGNLGAVTGGRMGAVGLRARASAFGLRYLNPFSYEAAGVNLASTLSHASGPFVLSVEPRASLGSWVTDSLEGGLRVLGADIRVQRPFGSLTATVSAGASNVDNGAVVGTFFHAGGDLRMDRGRWSALLELRAQRTPLEDEVGGGVRASVVVAPGVQVHAYAGRRLRDPLFGSEGTPGLSISATVRAVRWSPPRPPAVVAVGEARNGGRVVRFAIRAPGAAAVQLTGDFTGWDPVSMERRSDGYWEVRRVLPPGVHHFGFLVDGQWAIPADAPGVVEDGWGRENASVVVEP